MRGDDCATAPRPAKTPTAASERTRCRIMEPPEAESLTLCQGTVGTVSRDEATARVSYSRDWRCGSRAASVVRRAVPWIGRALSHLRDYVPEFHGSAHQCPPRFARSPLAMPQPPER